MEPPQLALLLIVIALGLFLLLQLPSRSSGRHLPEFLTLFTSVATGLALLYEMYSGYKKRKQDIAVGLVEIADRSWLNIRKYLYDHRDTTSVLYREMFPEEANLLNLPETNGPITREEIEAAHLIAQGIENYVTLHESDIELEWYQIFQKWWRSPRLNQIWPEIRNAYEGDTQRIIEVIRPQQFKTADIQ